MRKFENNYFGPVMFHKNADKELLVFWHVISRGSRFDPFDVGGYFRIIQEILRFFLFQSNQLGQLLNLNSREYSVNRQVKEVR